MKKHLILLLFFVSLISCAQKPERKFINAKEANNTLEITVSDGKYILKPYSEQIVETTFVPTGENLNLESHAVVLMPQPGIAILSENPQSITYATSGIQIKIQKTPFQISYSYKGKELLSEKNGYTKKDSTEMLDFNINATEALYGGGARAIGMNRRGNRLQLYNKAHYGYGDRSELLNFTVPMVLSSKIYAVHFDNAAIGYLDLDSEKNNTLAYETISGRKTYQVIAADNWYGLTEAYTSLTGKQPLPPRWTFGNFSSRFGYHSQKEVESVIDKFRKEQIPVDAVVLDLYWFGTTIQGTMGNFEFYKDSFPNPEKMIADLAAKNVKTVLITEPFVLTTSKKWPEAVAKKALVTDDKGNPFKYDFYFGNTGLIDIFKPEGKDWFWNIYKNLIKKGVAGMWGDLGEPEVFPSAARTVKGKADEVHNIYGHDWAKLVYEGYQKDFPNVRPFILMRAGYSGSQRYGMIPWSGDVGRSWGGLKSQPEIALQMGMQGLAYMHSDLGGFAGDNVDNELYVRWLQYGVFQPVFRPHAAESVPPEIVFREPKTKVLATEAVKLRYQMLPYNYTLAFENTTDGKPMMRPLFFDEPENINMYGKSDEYLWGNELLIAPITESGQKETTIYFPNTSNWFDFYGIKKYNAGSTEKIAVVENHLPVFVRGGGFIPMAKPMQSTKEYIGNDIDLHFWFDDSVKKSQGKMYNDDGENPKAIANGLYEILRFRSRFKNNILAFLFDLDKGKFVSADKNITLVVHNMASEPKKVTVGNAAVSFKWDKTTQTLEIKTVCKNQKEIQIQL